MLVVAGVVLRSLLPTPLGVQVVHHVPRRVSVCARPNCSTPPPAPPQPPGGAQFLEAPEEIFDWPRAGRKILAGGGGSRGDGWCGNPPPHPTPLPVVLRCQKEPGTGGWQSRAWSGSGWLVTAAQGTGLPGSRPSVVSGLRSGRGRLCSRYVHWRLSQDWARLCASVRLSPSDRIFIIGQGPTDDGQPHRHMARGRLRGALLGKHRNPHTQDANGPKHALAVFTQGLGDTNKD